MTAARPEKFEALRNRVDAALLAKVQDVVGASKKPQVGALFAAEHPTHRPRSLPCTSRSCGGSEFVPCPAGDG
jgi:hypothetical protein